MKTEQQYLDKREDDDYKEQRMWQAGNKLDLYISLLGTPEEPPQCKEIVSVYRKELKRVFDMVGGASCI